jgi:predicted ATPase
MITSMHIENFKCFKDFTIDLERFNVLIGLNGSGKSSLLDAVRLAASLPPGNNTPKSLRSPKSFSNLGTEFSEPLILPDRCWARGKALDKGQMVALQVYGDGGRHADRPFLHLRSDDGWYFRSILDINRAAVPDGQDRGRWLETNCPGWHHETFGWVAYHKFSPVALKSPSLLADALSEAGHRFPAYLGHILNMDRAAFESIERTFCQRFPQYTGIIMPSVNVTPHPQREGRSSTGRDAKDEYRIFLKFRTHNDVVLDAEDVSDGQVVSLAFITLGCLPVPPRILLVEEPENWIHHSSLKDIVGTLKQLSQEKGVQVILTTHSPYLLDEVEMNEVHVFEKDEEGAVHERKLSEFDNVESMKKDFMTGEIWSILSKAHNV